MSKEIDWDIIKELKKFGDYDSAELLENCLEEKQMNRMEPKSSEQGLRDEIEHAEKQLAELKYKFAETYSSEKVLGPQTVRGSVREMRNSHIHHAVEGVFKVKYELEDLLSEIDSGERPEARDTPCSEPPPLGVVLREAPNTLFELRDTLLALIEEIRARII
jgi:hypothetical protein